MRYLVVAIWGLGWAIPVHGEVMTTDCLIAASATAEIGAPVEGLLETIRVERGDRVVEGDELARLESEVERNRARLSALRAADDTGIRLAQAQAREAKERLGRAQSLFDRGLVRAEEVAEAALDLETADIEREASERALEIARGEMEAAEAEVARRIVQAPFSGVVIARSMEAGEYFSKGGVLLTLARVDPLHVEAFVSPLQLDGLVVGDPVSVTLENGAERSATVAVIDPVIDAATGTIGLRALLPNPDGVILSGQTCAIGR